MTRLQQAGWETGDINQIGSSSNGSSATTTVVSSTPTARSGTYCLKCSRNSTNTNSTGTARMRMLLGSTETELYIAFGLYTSNSGAEAAPNEAFLQVLDSAGNINLVFCCDGGTIRAYYANAGGAGSTSAQLTLIGAGSGSVSQTTWHLIEVHIVASTTTTGTCEIKLDGTTILTATSQRTAQTNANFAEVVLCMALYTATAVRTDYFAFDDYRVQNASGSVNNGWPGDERITMLIPNAAGDSTQFSRGGADSGSNYGQIDEVPPNGSTDYVNDSTVGHLDLYNLPSVTVQTVSAVNVIVQAQNPDGGGGSINLPTKTGAGQSDGSAQNITSSWAYFNRLLNTDPADSGAWDQTKINALQIGIKVAS